MIIKSWEDSINEAVKNINDYQTSTEYSVGDDRTTRTNFNITLNGYIIPDILNKYISYRKKFLSKDQVVFNTEIIK
jgi:hypothetical protein